MRCFNGETLVACVSDHKKEVYAEEVWQAFFNRLNKATTFVQPLIFVIVAVVIVMIYAAMLLPMYQNMEGMMS